MKKLLFALVLILISNDFVSAQDTLAVKKNPVLSQKFYIYAGAFAPFRQVKFGFNASIPSEEEEIIDFDETLSIEGIQITFNTYFNWRFSKKWSLNADFFSLRTRNNVVLKEDVVWDKYTLKKGSLIEGGYGAAILKVGFGRVLSRGDKHELEGLLGVYLLGLNGFISGIGYINEEEFILDKSPVSVTLPLPSFGLSYTYAPTTKLSLFARAEWFGIKIGNIDGSLWNLSPGVQYDFSKHIGARISYKYLNLYGNVNEENWKGSFELQFHGPSLGLSASF